MIKRAAFGRTASLGDLYDARVDEFCSSSIFEKSIPSSARILADTKSFGIQLVHTNSLAEKFSKMGISSEQQVSVLAGFIDPKGSGEYLSDRKKSARAVESSLISSYMTKDEQLNISHEDLRDNFSTKAATSGAATHIVTSISWGTCSVLSFNCENIDNRNVDEIKSMLSVYLKKLQLSIYSENSSDDSEEVTSQLKFNVRIFGDVLPGHQALPTSFKEALSLIKKLPEFVETCNDGLGKPLIYGLIPVSNVQAFLNDSIIIKTNFISCEEAVFVRAVQQFDKLVALQQQWYDFSQSTNKYKFVLQVTEHDKIKNFTHELEMAESQFKSELFANLIEVRSGKCNPARMNNLLSSTEEKIKEMQKVSNKFHTSALHEKINFAHTIIQKGAAYHGTTVYPENHLCDSKQKTVVLYFTEQGMTEKNWNRNLQIFLSKLEKHKPNYQYCAVDCDIHSCKTLEDQLSCVQIHQAGEILVEDVLKEKHNQIPLVKAMKDARRQFEKPGKSTKLIIPCSGRSCDPKELYEWTCKRCEEKVEYGFDQHVYCGCGKTPASSLKFKCTDPRHGISFESHDEQFLNTSISKLRPFQELNILILGETGVGKSTWINGFLNFLNYETLNDAINGELFTLVPSQFTVCNEQFQETLVVTGADNNELLEVGHSATQEAKVYPFPIGTGTIRIIDTPGIGDTRGAEQDKKNLENILGILSYFEEIHGICILLKPNNARLNVMFQFCIKELLKYLHKDASKNIIFCFTNSRGTFYRPGDTMPSLRKLLSEYDQVEIPLSPDTVYCFDSEAYRFLAAVKNETPVVFSDDEKLNFVTSWEKSCLETKRLLEHIRSLEPHPIKSTLNLNHARELVLKLARPLAEISKNIQENKAALEQEMHEIEKTNENIEELKKKQYIYRTEIEVKKLEHPKTVCINQACVKVWILNNEATTEYKTVCHENCTLLGVQADAIGPFMMRTCKVMALGVCIKCRHSYKEHKYVLYESTVVKRKVEDVNITQALREHRTAAEVKLSALNGKRAEIAKYEEELHKIEAASLRFACFLKTNAITPFNDALEQYMTHLIEVEENKVINKGASPVVLNSLRNSRDRYISDRNILQEKLEKGGDTKIVPPDANEVENLVKELQKLKLSGAVLRNALECMEITSKAVYKESSVILTNKHGKQIDKKWNLKAFCKKLLYG